MNVEQYKMVKAFAGEYGILTGLAWCITFLVIVSGMTTMNALLMMMGMAMMCALIAVPMYFAARLRSHLDADEQLSTGASWIFALMMLFNANLVTAVVEFCYFNFIDKGRLVETFRVTMSSPEAAATYRQMGMGDTLQTLQQTVDVLASLTPLDMAVNLFFNNILTVLILAIPVAYIARRKK